MTKKPPPPSDALEHWIPGAHRIKTTHRIPLKQRQLSPEKPRVRSDLPEKKQHRLYETSDADLSVEGVESVFFAKSGLQKRVLKKLKNGEYRCTAVLDIHGYTANIACQKVDHFIHAQLEGPQHCVLIIHGKGYRSAGSRPVLKNYLLQWLKQIPEVLAFCSAKPREGGTGAVYVLLKAKTTQD